MAVLGDTTVTKLTSLGPITGNLTGNAATATLPYGFSTVDPGTWGNTEGTHITGWRTSNVGSIDFRELNNALNVKIDGKYYQNEGRYAVIDTNTIGNYAPTKTGTGASGSWGISITGNAATATKATQDSAGQQINTTYIKGLSVSGKTITYTKGDGTTGTITTQDTTYGVMGAATASAAGKSGLVPAPAAGKQASFLRGDGTWVVPTDTKYSAGTGITLSGTTFSNAGVRSIAAGSATNQLVVNTNGTSATITINNVANATNASKATQLTTARTIDGVSFNGTANIVHYGSCSTAAATVEKAVACTGFTLATGARIIVKFTVTNTAKNSTLNVNSTGAKAIYYRGAAISAGYLAANRTYQFVYNGTQYELVGDIDTNTDTKVTQTLTTTNAEYSILGMADAAATANKTNTTRFSTGITMNPSTNTITASKFKGSLDGSYITGTIDGGELT